MMVHRYSKYLKLKINDSSPGLISSKYELYEVCRDGHDRLLYSGDLLADLEVAVFGWRQEQTNYLDDSKLEVSNNTWEIINEARKEEFKHYV